MKTLLRLAAFTLAASLAACGGGSGTGASGTIPANAGAAPAAASAATAQASLRITIPRTPAAATATTRRTQYVSLSAKSIQIDVTASSCISNCTLVASVGAGLDPAAPGCSSSMNGTVCSIPLPLTPGTYNANITLKDGPLSGLGQPTGGVISSNTSAPISVVAGSPNVNPVTLYGAPASALYTIVGNGGQLASHGFTVNTFGGSAQFRVDSIDTDGNLIIGPGSPVPAVTFKNASQGFALAQDPVTHIVTVTAPTIASHVGTTVQTVMQSQGCQSASACTSYLNLGTPQIWALADSVNRTVNIYGVNGPFNNATTQITGFTYPWAVAFDLGGNLFVADAQANRVLVYAPPYNGAPIATITTGINNPVALAIAPNGQLFVANYLAASVTAYMPPYTGAPLTIVNSVNQPYALAITPAGKLFIGNQAPVSGNVTVYDPPYAAPTVSTNFHVSFPSALKLDFSGNIWVAQSTGNEITRYTPSLGYMQSITTSNGPSAIAFSFDGTMAFADAVTGDVQTLSPPYTATPTVRTNNVQDPQSLAFDSLGDLYVSNYTAGNVLLLQPDPNAPNPLAAASSFVWHAPSITGPRGLAVYP
jgi:hypothetical protein